VTVMFLVRGDEAVEIQRLPRRSTEGRYPHGAMVLSSLRQLRESCRGRKTG
jgi:hypothetical protein